MVMSETAHAAFNKGAFYFGVETRIVKQKDLKADLDEMRRQIDENTVLIVASAPDYAFGNFDDVEEMGKIAEEFNIGLHSDCCFGSYINPFYDQAGFKMPYLYDFRVKGVTAISCDTHKYGCGPKGMSVLMFRTKELRR